MVGDDLIRESMSAVMDGEGSDIDIARVLKAVDSDPSMRAYWQRLQGSQAFLQSGVAPGSIDVSEGVRAVLVGDKPMKQQPSPLVSLAVAASVTLAVMIGGQQLLQGRDVVNPIAQVPGGVMPMQGAAPIQARYGLEPQGQAVSARPSKTADRSATSRVYEQLARERFERYGFSHAQKTAALQPNAVVPFARVPPQNR